MSDESAAWIERQYTKWMHDRAKHATITAFTQWLGVSRGTYNNWVLKKQTPTGDSLKVLGEKLGWEIYDIVGEPRPDPLLQLMNKLWGMLSDDEIRAIEKVVRRAAERSAEQGAGSKPEPRRVR